VADPEVLGLDRLVQATCARQHVSLASTR
jgi:hypothetical protein